MATAMEEALDRALNKSAPGGIGVPTERDRRVVAPEKAREVRKYRSISLKDKFDIAELCRRNIIEAPQGRRYAEGWSDARIAEIFGLEKVSPLQVCMIRKKVIGELAMGRPDTGKGFAGRTNNKQLVQYMERVESKLDEILALLKGK